MTIQPIEALDLLAGLEEHRRCEHSRHDGFPDRHEDGDEQFVRITAHCGCPDKPIVVVFCKRWLDWAEYVHCPTCQKVEDASEVYQILGPANPTTR